MITRTRRKTISHLSKMRHLDFLDIFLSDDNKIFIDEIQEKYDGWGGRFGLSPEGKPFFETSVHGPFFEVGDFEQNSRLSKHSEGAIDRSCQIDALFSYVLNRGIFDEIKENNTKIICEFLYRSFSSETETHSTFNLVPYHKSNIGKVLTIIPIKVLYADCDEEHPRGPEILAKLYNAFSNPKSDNYFLNPIVARNYEIDLSLFSENFEYLKSPEIIPTLKSLKHKDRQSKKNIKVIIDNFSNRISDYINFYHLMPLQKNEISEGFVLTSGEKTFKITTSKFNAMMHEKMKG